MVFNQQSVSKLNPISIPKKNWIPFYLISAFSFDKILFNLSWKYLFKGKKYLPTLYSNSPSIEDHNILLPKKRRSQYLIFPLIIIDYILLKKTEFYYEVKGMVKIELIILFYIVVEKYCFINIKMYFE